MTDLELSRIIEETGTPAYIFDTDLLKQRILSIREIIGDKINLCYSIKANPFIIREMECLVDKLEVCSPGELNICGNTKVSGKKIIFSGVNKTQVDTDSAVKYDCDIYTAESLQHLTLLQNSAEKNSKKIDVLLRLTSGNQFGMDETIIYDCFKNKSDYPNLNFVGIHFFSGTGKKKPAENEKEIDFLLSVIENIEKNCNHKIEKIEYGPGIGFPYFINECFQDTLAPLKNILPFLEKMSSKYTLTIEMGRFIASECGYYVTSVVDSKVNKDINYAIIDGGMNHINYYGQTMAMKVPVIKKFSAFTGEQSTWTLCGSLCTAADVLVRKYETDGLQIGDKLVFCNIGAYSVTEGIYLFLSRTMPKITKYSEEKGLVVLRDFLNSDIINTPKEN